MDGSVRAWHLDLASLTAVGKPVQAHQGWTRALHYDTRSDAIVSCGDDGHVKARCLQCPVSQNKEHGSPRMARRQILEVVS